MLGLMALGTHMKKPLLLLKTTLGMNAGVGALLTSNIGAVGSMHRGVTILLSHNCNP